MAIQKKYTLDKDHFEGFVDARDCLIATNAARVLFGRLEMTHFILSCDVLNMMEQSAYVVLKEDGLKEIYARSTEPSINIFFDELKHSNIFYEVTADDWQKGLVRFIVKDADKMNVYALMAKYNL